MLYKKLKLLPLFCYYDFLFALFFLMTHKLYSFHLILSILFWLGLIVTLIEIAVKIIVKYQYSEGLTTKFGLIFVSLSVLDNLFVWIHYSRERYIYFWDSSMYWTSTINFTNMYMDNFNSAIKSVYFSINNDVYNLVPTVLLTVPMKIFGYTYTSYSLIILNLYILPTTFLLILLIRKILIRNHMLTLKTEYATLIIPFLFTPFLIPVVNGYLDAAGMIMLTLILMLMYSDDFIKFNLFRNLVFTFLLLVLLFTRRWYAFFVVGAITAFGVVTIIKILLTTKEKKWSQIYAFLSNMVFVGSCCAICLFGLFKNFVVMSIINNNIIAFSAYQNGNFITNMIFVSQYIGLLIILVIFCGLYFLIRRGDIYFAIFLIIQSLISYTLFIRIQSIQIQHYYIFSVQLCLLLVIGTCWIISRQKKMLQFTTVGVIGLILVYNFSQTFLPSLSNWRNANLFSNATAYPKVRNDIVQLTKMVEDLNKWTQNNGKKVYILGSSTILNGSLISDVYMPYQINALPSILGTHDIDLRDGFPTNFFLADYVAVPSIPQVHLRPDDQKVIVKLTNLFNEKPGLRNFKPIKVYHLDNNVDVTIYKKIGAFSKSSTEDIIDYFRSSYPNIVSPVLANINPLLPLLNENKLKNDRTMIWENNNSLEGSVISGSMLSIPFDLGRKYTSLSFNISSGSDNITEKMKINLKIIRDNDVILKKSLALNSKNKISISVPKSKHLQLVFQNENKVNCTVSIFNSKIK